MRGFRGLTVTSSVSRGAEYDRLDGNKKSRAGILRPTAAERRVLLIKASGKRTECNIMYPKGNSWALSGNTISCLRIIDLWGVMVSFFVSQLYIMFVLFSCLIKLSFSGKFYIDNKPP